jgi:hypothetical protein
MNEIDPNRVLAATAATLAKDFLKSFTSGVGRKLSKTYQKYFESFSPYLERTYVSCSLVKTIINKENPVNIEEIYVKSRFRCAGDVVEDDSLCQYARDGKRIIVTGFGGIGKTVFCKYLFRTVFHNPGGKVPVFFELRRINDITEKNLLTYIRVSLSGDDGIIPEDTFRSIMEDGRFIFILDGFDEIPDEFKNQIQRQILDLSHHYRNCGFVVSSRLDDRFASWQEFFVFRAMPFEREQTNLVIRKAKFDNDTKKEFFSNIFEKNYEKYKEFFSTPLLTLMMLMTYLQIRHIPENIHIFYRYAFQTLFTLHDASKEGFQRKRRLSLSEQEFIEVFSIFCLSTYADLEHTFSEQRCLDYISKSKKRASKSFDERDFLIDSTDSINMLFKDGNHYSFIHRSFQEYFAAYAATHYFVRPIRRLVKRLPRRGTDTVFSMMRAMNTSVVDEFYLIPEYEELSEQISLIIKATDPIEILKLSGYYIEFGFRVIDEEISPSIYSSYSESDVDVFSTIAQLMFKDRAPKDLINEDDMQIIPSFKGLQNLFKGIIFNSNKNKMVNIVINCSKGTIVVHDHDLNGDNSGESPVGEVASLLISDVNWRKNIPIMELLSHRIKARLVFIKKSLEDIRRGYRKSRDISDDILSM